MAHPPLSKGCLAFLAVYTLTGEALASLCLSPLALLHQFISHCGSKANSFGPLSGMGLEESRRAVLSHPRVPGQSCFQTPQSWETG